MTLLTTLLLAWLLVTLASSVGLLAFLTFDERQAKGRATQAQRRAAVAFTWPSGTSRRRQQAAATERTG
jgi:hypothetical protein